MSLLPLDCACQGLQQNSLDVCSSETCCKQSQHLYILEYVEQKQQQQQQQQPQPQPPQQPQQPQQQPRRFKLPDLSVQLRDLILVMIEIYKVSS
jgi:hypothetical protein